MLSIKVTRLSTLFCFLAVVCTSAQKERLYPERGTRQHEQHSEIPPEINLGNENNRDILLGRSEISGCGIGSGGSIHHHAPCDENVESKGINNSDSISTRYDPNTEPPSGAPETPTQPCVSSDGTFGDISDAALLAVPVTYHYEMQIVAGTSTEKVNDEVLPKLEQVIVDSILHEAFPEECTAKVIGKRKKRKLHRSHNNRLLEVTGVSMYPPDYITTNSCNVLVSNDSRSECLVLKGELTIYINDQIVEEQNRVENLIKENMNSGVYNSAREEIVQLYYLKKEDPIESNTSEGTDGKIDGGKRNNRTLRMGLFVGIGALSAVFAGVVFRVTRRMRNNDDQTEMQTAGPQS